MVAWSAGICYTIPSNKFNTQEGKTMSSRDRNTAKPSFKLREVILPGRKTPEKGKYRAIVTERDSYGTSRVIAEMLDYSSLRLSPYIVESVVSGVMESMIKSTLEDGITRRFGDYFAVRLEVKGTFDSEDAAFDPRKNEVKVVLVPLKRFRKAVETRRPQNKVKPPRALMTDIRGESSELEHVKFGENIVIIGRDLTVTDMTNRMEVFMYDRSGHKKYDSWSIDQMIEHTPTRIVVPFPSAFKKSDFASNFKKLYFMFTTDSGKPNGPIRHIKYKHGVEVDFD